MSVSTRPFRVVVVGQGLIGSRRAATLAALDGVAVAATVDPLATQAASLPFGIPHFLGLEQVDPSDYDAAVVSVPHDVATGLARQVLAAGKPVLLEKPLGVSGTEARALEGLAARLALPSFVGFNYRFLPSVRLLAGEIAAGRLGVLRNVDLMIGHGGHPGSAEGWKLDPKRAGGGVLLDPGVHLLDLLLQIAPGAACRDVEATRGFWGTGIEEDLVATFREGPLIATVRVSHVRWVNTFRIEAFGDDAYAIAEGRGGNYGPITIRRGERWAWARGDGVGQRETEHVLDFGPDDPSLADETSAVVGTWRGVPPENDGLRPATMSEARAVTELCDELYARIGQPS